MDLELLTHATILDISKLVKEVPHENLRSACMPCHAVRYALHKHKTVHPYSVSFHDTETSVAVVIHFQESQGKKNSIHIVNIMVVDVLATQGARTSATMILIYTF